MIEVGREERNRQHKQRQKRRVGLTETIGKEALRSVIDTHVDGPGGNVANHHGTQTAIHSLDTILLDDGASSAQ